MRRSRSIVGLGEVLWDVFPDGPRFGGAPANFACIASQLSAGDADVDMVSSLGQDELGAAAIVWLEEMGVGTEFVAIGGLKTGRVDVTVDTAGAASYVFAEDVAWDHLEWTPALGELAAQAQAVCFGTLAQRTELSSATIQRFVRSTPSAALRVFDINLRTPYWSEKVIRESLELANVLKLNDAELPILGAMLNLAGGPVEQLKQLIGKYALGLVALTRGAEGSLLVSTPGEVSELAAPPTRVVDTVGAGDAFTAAMVVGLMRGLGLVEIHQWASEVAAFVCSKPGATPQLPEGLRKRN
jgi:fructokinase